MSSSPPLPVPNHHAHHAGFSGLRGLAAALSMTVGRTAIARLAADLVAVSETDRVVDVGCGPGTAAREAARRGAQVTGIDPAPVMLAVARRIPGRRHITWMSGAAESVALPDDSQTIAWSLSTVHHWADIRAGLAECFRVLQPGGRFLAIERNELDGARGHASHGWTDGQGAAFAEECRTTGFDAGVSTHGVDRGKVIVVLGTKP